MEEQDPGSWVIPIFAAVCFPAVVLSAGEFLAWAAIFLLATLYLFLSQSVRYGFAYSIRFKRYVLYGYLASHFLGALTYIGWAHSDQIDKHGGWGVMMVASGFIVWRLFAVWDQDVMPHLKPASSECEDD